MLLFDTSIAELHIVTVSEIHRAGSSSNETRCDRLETLPDWPRARSSSTTWARSAPSRWIAIFSSSASRWRA